jgi:hypothetical protein
VTSHEYSLINSYRKEHEMSWASFKPRINPVSKMIAESSRRNQKPVFDRLVLQAKETVEKKELTRAIVENRKQALLPFSPQIDPVYLSL